MDPDGPMELTLERCRQPPFFMKKDGHKGRVADVLHENPNRSTPGHKKSAKSWQYDMAFEKWKATKVSCFLT